MGVFPWKKSPSKAARSMLESDGLLGWATADLVRLEALSPGLISRVLTVSPATRHAIFLVLARRHHDRLAGVQADDEVDAALANVLRRERARAIIEHAFGAAEDGLIGALARLGAEPLSSPGSYARLHSLFRRAEDRHKGEALQHVGQITGKMLRVIDALDARWVHRETLTRIETMAGAITFNRAVAFAQKRLLARRDWSGRGLHRPPSTLYPRWPCPTLCSARG